MAERGASSPAAVIGLRDEVNVCQLCGALENLSLCGGCKGTWYCCKDHQRQDWKVHKHACKKKTNSFNSVEVKVKEVERACTTSGSVDRQHTMTVFSDADVVPVCGDDDIIIISPDSPAKSSSDESTRNSPSTLKREAIVHKVRCAVGDTDSAHQTQGSAAVAHTTVENNNGTGTGERDGSQVLGNSTTVGGREGGKANGSKKRNSTCQRQQPWSMATLLEDDPQVERYYLSSSTHRINLPPIAKSTMGRSQASNMGMGEESLSPAQAREQYLSVLRSRFNELAIYAVECLTRFGVCVMDNILGDKTAEEILKEVQQLQMAGVMTQGQLVHGPSSSSNKYIRGDMITWVDGKESRCEHIHFLISCMDAVILQCASRLDTYTINERTKAMVACYPGKKTRYVRHVDNPNGDGRCITCIYYLNKDWDVRKDGGLLRIYPEGMDQMAKIEPKLDRLIFFWSDRRNPHEVEEAFKERYAITVWYYDAEERAQALKRFKRGSKSSRMKSEAVPLFTGSESL